MTHLPTQYCGTVHHAVLCSQHCSIGTHRLLLRVAELFHVVAEVGDGRKYVGYIGKFDGIWLVAVAVAS
jgi:hypothetical protein